MKTNKALNDSIKKQLMIQALTKSLGIVSTACKASGISRNCHYEWLKKDEEYKREVDSIAEVELDFVISKLHQRINEGSDTAIIYYLKCKGRGRGFSDGSDVPKSDGFRVDVKFLNSTADIREQDDTD